MARQIHARCIFLTHTRATSRVFSFLNGCYSQWLTDYVIQLGHLYYVTVVQVTVHVCRRVKGSRSGVPN